MDGQVVLCAILLFTEGARVRFGAGPRVTSLTGLCRTTKNTDTFKTDFGYWLKPTKYLNTIYLYLFTTGLEITSTIALISACFSISSSS